MNVTPEGTAHLLIYQPLIRRPSNDCISYGHYDRRNSKCVYAIIDFLRGSFFLQLLLIEFIITRPVVLFTIINCRSLNKNKSVCPFVNKANSHIF